MVRGRKRLTQQGFLTKSDSPSNPAGCRLSSRPFASVSPRSTTRPEAKRIEYTCVAARGFPSEKASTTRLAGGFACALAAGLGRKPGPALFELPSEAGSFTEAGSFAEAASPPEASSRSGAGTATSRVASLKLCVFALPSPFTSSALCPSASGDPEFSDAEDDVGANKWPEGEALRRGDAEESAPAESEVLADTSDFSSGKSDSTFVRQP